MTPCDLRNEVMIEKTLYVIDIVLKFPICEFGKARPNSFPGILSAKTWTSSKVKIFIAKVANISELCLAKYKSCLATVLDESGDFKFSLAKVAKVSEFLFANRFSL